MGLSERKQKQKIGLDPRNLAWRHDSTSFGAQMLLKAGHTPGTSLGLSDNGLVNPIAAARKLDASGIGMGRARREGGVEGGGVGSAGGNLDDLLRRLQAAESEAASSGSDAPQGKTLSGFARAVTGSGNQDTVVVTEEVSSPGASSSTTAAVLGRPSRMAHRNKFRTAKQLASQNNAAAMAEILGIRSPAASSPSGSPAPASGADTPAVSDVDNELITKNKEAVSVQDYFKAKMEAKKAAMLAAIALAAGGAPPAPLDPAAVAFEQPVVVVAADSPAPVPVPEEAEASGSSGSDDEASASPAPAAEAAGKKGKGKAVAAVSDADNAPAGGLSPKEAAKAEKKRLKKEAKRAAKQAAKSGSSGAATPATDDDAPKKSKKRSAPADDDEADEAAAAKAAAKAERKAVKKAKRA